MKVLGFMTGTSLDAIDMAVLETDGETVQEFGPAGERPLDEALRDLLSEATRQALDWPRNMAAPAIFDQAARALAEAHFVAGEAFLARHGMAWADLDLIAMHGQTVLHERPTSDRPGRTMQLGDGERLAALTGRPVAFDFRSADIAAGGQGAPLVPLYHVARLSTANLDAPSAALNLGGIANITIWRDGAAPIAFDTGPANGMIDELMQARGVGRFDPDGRHAAAGKADERILKRLLAHPYFRASPPKSLDRYEFPISCVDGLSIEDAAATLTAFAAEAVGRGFEKAGVVPSTVIVCGGGRRNPTLVQAIRRRLRAPVLKAEAVLWRGDAIEAEAMAFLGARCARGLPITLPSTTGVKAPMTGGRIVEP